MPSGCHPDKLLAVSFIEEVSYTKWLANVVPVAKKDQGNHALWAEECRSNLLKADEQGFQGEDRQDYGGLCRQHASQSSPTSRPHQESCRSFQPAPKYQMKLNSSKCTFGVLSGQFLGYLVTKEASKHILIKSRPSST
ncbi:transposable element gene [Prunus dulcis]|uniref:Transposable element protein n=1 Tax=Prunus dulcis TaxID=3755 RepID=A0A4Y1RYT7_PRUDU|nr:transposable element gene [Prunus dulcis]